MYGDDERRCIGHGMQPARKFMCPEMPHQNELAGACYVLDRDRAALCLAWPLHTSHPCTGDLPARILRNHTSHRALFISDLYVVANELTQRPALFAAERQNDAFAFFGLAYGIKANYE